MVVKPSEFAPVSAGIMLAEVAEEAGFPAGVINVVTHAPGTAGAIADEFFDRPEVRVINLIGGVKTARMLAERAGRLLKRTVMELGGFNPMIIVPDWEGQNPRLQATALARARQISFGDGVPAGRAHCIRNPFTFGADHEVSKDRATG